MLMFIMYFKINSPSQKTDNIYGQKFNMYCDLMSNKQVTNYCPVNTLSFFFTYKTSWAQSCLAAKYDYILAKMLDAISRAYISFLLSTSSFFLLGAKFNHAHDKVKGNGKTKDRMKVESKTTSDGTALLTSGLVI